MNREKTLIKDEQLWRVIAAEQERIPWRRKRGQRYLKRAFDLIAGASLLILLSPCILLTAVLVRITSPGPVLMVQTRVGLDGAPFRMFKFRSMRAEMADGFVSALSEVTGTDPRLTPIGKWLRAWRLDE